MRWQIDAAEHAGVHAFVRVWAQEGVYAGWCVCLVPGPAQEEAARGCGTLQEACHGRAPVVEHKKWCSCSCSGLRVLGSSAKEQESVAGAPRGPKSSWAAVQERQRRWRAAAHGGAR